MQPPFSADMYDVVLMAYLIAMAGVNFIAFLISDFYRKKFNQPAPRLGYCVAIGLNMIACISIIMQEHIRGSAQIIQIFLLPGSGILSMYSCLTLFFTMNKVRK